MAQIVTASCAECGSPFPVDLDRQGAKPKTCSDTCRKARDAERHRVKYQEMRAALEIVRASANSTNS